MYIAIRTIKSCLRQLSKDMSHRAISRNERISPTTVGKIKTVAQSSNCTYVQLLEKTDNELEKLFAVNRFHKKRQSAQRKKSPDFQNIVSELQRPNVTRMLLWQEYRINNPEGIGYSRFCELLARFTKASKLPMNIFYTAGEFIQVDFCGTSVPIFDQVTGEEQFRAQVFVGVLPASGYAFIFAVKTQSIKDWKLCHIEMYNFFGGVSKFIQPDNLKSAILQNNKHGITVTPAFSQFAEHYDTIVMPTRVRSPQDKSLAEITVKLVQQQILAKYRDFRFFSLSHLNHVLQDELKIFNNKVTDVYPKGRYQNYLDIDLPYLQPLPLYDAELCDWQYDVKANGYVLEILGFLYSVNYAYSNQVFNVKITDSLIEIFFKGQSVAVHQRIFKGRSIKHEHMPPNHQAHNEMQPENLIEWATSIGENTQFVIEYLLENKGNYANNLRKLNKIKKLLIDQNNTAENIERAFEHIVNMKSLTVTSVEMVIKTKAYLNVRKVEKVKNDISIHKNIRGANYYSKKGVTNVSANCL